MPIEITFAEAKEHLAAFLDKAVEDKEVIIVCRDNAGDAAIIAADELRSLMETVHLFSSPRNAQRLLAALDRALKGEGQDISIVQLRQMLSK
jgi:antitoxin YefM